MDSIARKLVRLATREVRRAVKKSEKKHRSDESRRENGTQAEPSTAVVVPAAPDGVLHPIALPHPGPSPPKGQEPWNMIKTGIGKARVSTNVHPDGPAGHQESLRIDFVPNSVGSKCGHGFYAAPRAAFPCEEVALSYQVYFPPDFGWVKGGKLPGLYLGAPGATGGNWERDSGSVRVMWQPHGAATAYVYVPCQVAPSGSKDDALAAQCPEFHSICHATKKMGCHLWKNSGACFVAGQWNFVRIRVAMNTPGQHDGRLELEINGTHRVFDKMMWRSDPRLHIGGVCAVTFYGGHTQDFAAPPGSWLLLKDFTVWTAAGQA